MLGTLKAFRSSDWDFSREAAVLTTVLMFPVTAPSAPSLHVPIGLLKGQAKACWKVPSKTAPLEYLPEYLPAATQCHGECEAVLSIPGQATWGPLTSHLGGTVFCGAVEILSNFKWPLQAHSSALWTRHGNTAGRYTLYINT